MYFDVLPFDMFQGLSHWIKVAGFMVILVLIVTSVGALLSSGPKGLMSVFRELYEGIRDGAELLTLGAWRRIWAVAILTIREAIRRKALLVFVIFGVLFMFGSWFLTSADEKADIQIQRHVVFVFTAVSWLVLPVILMLACWGIPEDIKARSMHTVVTKPVRRDEVVLGRMLGFSLVATGIVALMGLVGFFWIERQIPQGIHDRLVCKVPLYGRLTFLDRQGEPTKSGINVGDVWTFRSYIEGSTKATAIWNFDHVSESTLKTPTDLGIEGQPADEALAQKLKLSPGQGLLVTRVVAGSPAAAANVRPHDVILTVKDQAIGQPGDLATAVQGFKVGENYPIAINRDGKPEILQLPWQEYLSLQTGFEAFRTHKGIINTGLLCELTLVNPQSKLRVPLPPFEVAEYRGDGNQTPVPRVITYYDSEKKESRSADLITDIVSDGVLQVEARCLNQEQFLGMARPDLFIRIADRPFYVGFFKAIAGVWMEALVVVMIGVAASCFLKGPIATLLTFAILIVGQGFRELIEKIVTGQQLGGGPIESIYRMVTHMNQTVGLELSKPVENVIKVSDKGVENGLWLVQQTFPNLTYFNMSPYVAKGFDVDFRAAILPAIAVTVAFLVPCVLLGYYALKLRELESK
jgi:PDZ domain